MKIANILESFATNIDNTIHTKVGRALGFGNFRSVYQNNTDPHTVIKRFMTYDNAFDLYAKYLIKNNISQQSPFFPKFFNIKVGKNGSITTFEMEKLTPAHKLSEHQVEMIIENYLSEIEKHHIFTSFSKSRDTIKNRAVNIFVGGISDIIRHGSSLLLQKSDPLLKAIDILKHIKKTIDNQSGKSFPYDMTDRNIMFRITQYGVQPVFADPFFGISISNAKHKGEQIDSE